MYLEDGLPSMLKDPGEETQRATVLPRKEKLRVPALEILPSDRFSFLTHLDVTKRFVALSHNGTQALDASRVEGEGVPSQAASLNVRFLKSIGLLTSTDRGQYLPTQEAIRLVTYRSVSDDKARPVLASLLERTWIVSTARSVLSPTKPTKDEVLLGELAITAQTDKEKKRVALQVLVDYLLFSGLVRAEGDGLILAGSADENPATGETAAKSSEGIQTSQVSRLGLEPLNKDWHLIQTEDFILQIRSSPEAFDELNEYLPMVRRKIDRAKSKRELTTTATTGESAQ